MLPLVQPRVCRAVASTTARSFSLRAAHRSAQTTSQASRFRPLVWASVFFASAVSAWGASTTLRADAPSVSDVTVDPSTSIGFPNTLIIPSKVPLPPLTLVGVGVRTVSFLGIKVYSIGFYADLNNAQLNVPKSASPEEKIELIVRNSTCALRIIPTRSTSFSHLRDGFMRALQARMALFRQRGQLSKEEEFSIQSPLHKFKTMFPNTPLAKHTPLDILLAPPEPRQPRSLIIRDLGSVQHDWLSPQFFLAYFEGSGLSPPMKKSVFEKLEDFGY